jgi:hypothetical protein
MADLFAMQKMLGLALMNPFYSLACEAVMDKKETQEHREYRLKRKKIKKFKAKGKDKS